MRVCVCARARVDASEGELSVRSTTELLFQFPPILDRFLQQRQDFTKVNTAECRGEIRSSEFYFRNLFAVYQSRDADMFLLLSIRDEDN